MQSLKIWISYELKKRLIATSISTECEIQAIANRAIKEFLDKGGKYIKDTLDDEDFKADNFIKSKKEKT